MKKTAEEIVQGIIAEAKKGSLNESVGGRLFGVFDDLDQYTKKYIPGASSLITKEDVKQLQKANAALLKIYKKILAGKGLIGWDKH